MKIERDRFYRTRDGRKALCVYNQKEGEYPCVIVAASGQWSATEKGSYYSDDSESDLDIVSQWVEPLDLDHSALPAWANKFVTMDADYRWTCSDSKPERRNRGWDSTNYAMWIPPEHNPKGFDGEWKDSLHEWNGSEWVRVKGEEA